MIFPPPLVAGDTVAIVATARKVSRDEMAPAIGILQQWGLQVAEGKIYMLIKISLPVMTLCVQKIFNGLWIILK